MLLPTPYMITFIYLAYLMLALFYETVPAFGNIWKESPSGIGRYRMAIEYGDTRDW